MLKARYLFYSELLLCCVGVGGGWAGVDRSIDSMAEEDPFADFAPAPRANPNPNQKRPEPKKKLDEKELSKLEEEREKKKAEIEEAEELERQKLAELPNYDGKYIGSVCRSVCLSVSMYRG